MANAPKRILHVFSTLSVGGPQRRFADYIARSQAGFCNSVYAMDSNYDALNLVDGIEAPSEGSQLVPKGNTMVAIKACRRILKARRPELLVTYNWGATEWALANKLLPVCPMVHIQDGFTEDEQNGEIFARRFLRSIAYRSCRAVVVPSRTLEKQVTANWGIRSERLKFIPNGIDTKRFTCSPDQGLVASLGIDPSKQIIGTVAGLRPEKNVGRLIEAYSAIEDQFPETQLVIVGDGVGMSALKMLAERVCKKDNVIFAGSLAQPELILPAFDLFALSSDTEQMPLSVIEAMAAALPVVSTDVGDVAHMVADENKNYVTGRDAQTLAASLSALLGAADKAKEIGAANQAKAKTDYAINQMIERYDELFTDCCG